MNKEQILADLHDLILTLRSPNFQDSGVREKWNQKRQQVTERIERMSSVDKRWMEEKHREWLIAQGVKIEKSSWL